jgi:hypothetical protein
MFVLRWLVRILIKCHGNTMKTSRNILYKIVRSIMVKSHGKRMSNGGLTFCE